MTLTRNEFKEFVGLYQEAWEKFKEYAGVIDENFLDELLFPAFTFIVKSIGMYDDKTYGDLIFGGLIGDCPDFFFIDEGEVTTDLDKIYDYYLKDKDAANILLLEEKMCELEDSLNA